MTPAEAIALLDAEHTEHDGECQKCPPGFGWPCPTRVLLDEVRELRAWKSDGIVSLCVCPEAASQRPDCACVTCTVARAERERDELRERHNFEYHRAENAEKTLRQLRNEFEELRGAMAADEAHDS